MIKLLPFTELVPVFPGRKSSIFLKQLGKTGIILTSDAVCDEINGIIAVFQQIAGKMDPPFRDIFCQGFPRLPLKNPHQVLVINVDQLR